MSVEPHGDPGDTPMTATYVTVLVLEALVICALWVVGQYFGR